MTYTRYITEGFVLAAYPSGEANKLISLFTKDLGRVEAYAQSVRLLSSKLRYALQTHAHIHVELVQGHRTWRIVNAEEKHMLALGHDYKAAHYILYARMLSLVRTLVGGEGKEEPLYHELTAAFSFLTHTPLTDDEYAAVEVLLVMRILMHLGYWDGGDAHAHLLTPHVWSTEMVRTCIPMQRDMRPLINRVLRETHM